MDNSQEDDILTSFIDSLDQKGSSESIFDQSASILKEPERYRSDEGTAQGETLSLQGMVVFKEMTRSADLCLRFSEETRCENAMFKASMKLATGSIFTVRIDLNDSGGLLGIGVKELQLKMLTVIMLKRQSVDSVPDDSVEEIKGVPGPAEAAGLKFGDVIFGVNFAPVRDGSKTLLSDLENKKKSAGSNGGYIHLQCWRCHQLCDTPAPGLHFPRMDDVVPKAFQLYRDGIFSDWERWNFIDILLNNMLLDLKHRQQVRSRNGPVLTSYELGMVKKVGGQLSSVRDEARKQLQVVDLERNILHAKCLRAALCVRIVHTRVPQKSDSVVYVLRVEDVETGLQWVVHRRYRDFHALHEELESMSKLTRGLPFPQKKISLIFNAKLVEARMLSLEQYTRRVLYILNANALHDPMASRALRHVQRFLSVDKYIDCIYPPPVDDQRHMELLAFRFLNDFNSPACQQCMRFVSNVNLENLQDPSKPEGDGYRPALKHLGEAMSEVEQFTLNRHQEQMKDELRARRPEMSAEAIAVFVRRCVRRQVESALFLPLRRAVYRLVIKYTARSAQLMQTSLNTLSVATPAFFMVDPNALRGTSLSKAIGKFRDIVHAYLPADQGQLLMHAAAAVVELHAECATLKTAKALKAALHSEEALRKSASVDDIDSKEKPDGVRTPPLQASQNPEEEVPASATETEEASQTRTTDWSSSASVQPVTRSSRGGQRRWSLESGTVLADDAPHSDVSDHDDDPYGNFSLGPPTTSSAPSKALGVPRRKEPETEPKTRPRRSSTGETELALGGAGLQRDSIMSRDYPWADYCNPSRSTFSFRGQDVLGDPVKTIFASLETLPAAKLYRDDENIINPSDLSFLDDDIPDDSPAQVSPSESAMDLDQSMLAQPSTPSRDAASPPPPGTAVTAWSAKKAGFTTGAAAMARMETFSPSIDGPRYSSSGPDSREKQSPPRRGSTGSAVAKKADLSADERRVQSMRVITKTEPVSRGFERLEIEEGSANGDEPTGEQDRRGKTSYSHSSTSRLPSFGSPLGSISAVSESVTENTSPSSIAGSFESDQDLSLFDATADRLSEGIGQQQRTRNSRLDSNTRDLADEARNTSNFYAGQMLTDAVSADDFLPMFTFTLAKAMLPQLVIIKEIMTTLVADEETYGECGYYLATLEAALKHISDLSEDFMVESERN